MKFAIVYDNTAFHPHLASAWGFSCLVGDELLFDTGGDGLTLLANMAKMGIAPLKIRTVVLSHPHGDHTGGLGGLLSTGVRPAVYVPCSFPARFKAKVRALTPLIEVHEPREICAGIHTTGEVGRGIVEQALVVKTREEEIVVITGCAHPGVVQMVRRAKESTGGEVALVMGGFHLGGASRCQIKHVIAGLRDLGVQQVAPCHCTGDRAREMFAEAYGTDFIPVGAGWQGYL
ncbi:MAG: MBL fold metallo-hydrolase [Anaerolineae bacterium]|nr:MBL fold metallo-hydrolase [Anaerolineae bacterium]